MKKAAGKENIYEAIYDVVRAIPKGRVTNYGAIAAAVGTKSGARVVGYALMHCPDTKPKVPAHRVVNSFGFLSGKHHFRPPSKMQQLLEKEGVRVMNDTVVDFKTIFWDPLKELSFE